MTTDTEREHREFWAVTYELNVLKVVGYTCAPNTPNYWWCPSMGMSAEFGKHLFWSEQEALRACAIELTAELSRITAKLDAVTRRLK